MAKGGSSHVRVNANGRWGADRLTYIVVREATIGSRSQVVTLKYLHAVASTGRVVVSEQSAHRY